MSRLLKYCSLLALLGLYGCAYGHIPDARDDLMKVMAHEKVSASTLGLLGVTYDPHDSRLLEHREIARFLEDAKIPAGALPASLRQALEERRAVGVLVTRFSRTGPGSGQPVPRRLDETRRMLLLWEISLEQADGTSSHGGTGALWFDENTECKAGEKKCPDYWCDSSAECGESMVAKCVGWFRCPPCRECTCCEFRL